MAPPPDMPSMLPPSGAPFGAMAPPPTGGPVPPVVDDDDRDGFSKAQLAVLGVVVLAVVGLFGYMIANTGGSEPERTAAASTASERAASAAPTTTTTAAPSTTAPPRLSPSTPVDLEAFCRGGYTLVPIETRIYAAFLDADWVELKDLVTTRRGEWTDAIDTMSAGAPQQNVDDLLQYREVSHGYFDVVARSGGWEDFAAGIDRVAIARANSRAVEVFSLLEHHCG